MNQIEWDEPQPALRAGLVVERCVGDVMASRQSATLDDLKRACEALGLDLCRKEAFDAIVAKGEEWRKLYETIPRATWSADAALKAENATLRAQLDELRAKHNATVAAANRDIEAIRAELAAAKARLRRDEVPEDRATDEELVRIAVSYWTAGGGKSIETLPLAVAARVRRERGGCLVGRLVAKGFGFWVDPPALVTPRIHEADVGTCSVGICGVAGSEVRVQPADVPATLARLAGLGDTSPPLSGAI